MICNEVKENILKAYDVEHHDEAALSHLGECEDCQAWNDALEDVSRSLRDLDAPPLPEDFARNVALLAREKGETRWQKIRKTFSSVSNRGMELLLGAPEAAGKNSFSYSIVWSLVLAVVSGSATAIALYCGQAEQKSHLTAFGTVISRRAMAELIWMPFVKAARGDYLECCFVLAMIMAGVLVLFCAARLLNLGGLWKSLVEKERLSLRAVVLPLGGIYMALVVWHLLMLAGYTVIGGGSYAESSYFIPRFYGQFPFSGLPGFVLYFLNPFVFPLAGSLLCVIAFVLIVIRGKGGIPSYARWFYGCLGGTWLAYTVTQYNWFHTLAAVMEELWSYNSLLLVGPRTIGVTVLILMAALGFQTGLLLSICRYSRQWSLGAFLTKRLAPLAVTLIIVGVVISLMLVPVAKKVAVARQELQQVKALHIPAGEKVVNTIIPLVKDPARASILYFPDGVLEYSYREILKDERFSATMESILQAPYSVKSLQAYKYLMEQALVGWDHKAVMELKMNLVKNHYLSSWNFSFGTFYNGRPPGESLAYIDELTNDAEFFAGDQAIFSLAFAYAVLGNVESARELLSRMDKPEHPRKNYAKSFYWLEGIPVQGSISGIITCKGTPAADLQLRLFPRDDINGYYVYSKKDSTDNRYVEEDFLYLVKNSLEEETSVFPRPKFHQNVYDYAGWLPIISRRTDAEGRFEFNHLLPGQYFMVLRYPGKLDKSTQKTGVGIIEISATSPAVELGNIEFEMEGSGNND